MIQPPSPQAGLQSLSSLLNLSQQQQQLQTGQFRQQEAQAGAQAAQQAMSERQIMIQSIRSGKDPDGNSIMLDGGDPTTGRPAPDPQKLMALARRWMPQTGDSVIQKITKTQSDKTSLAEATRGLEQNYRNDLSGVVQAFKTDDPTLPNNAKAQDVTNAIDAYIAKNPAAASAGHWATNLIQDHFDSLPAAGKNDALQHIAQVFQPASVTAAQNLPQAAVTGAGTVNRGGVHGGLSQPPGAATGSPINPTPPQVAGATARQTGTSGADIDTSNLVVAAQRNARANIDLTKRIDQLADVVSPGRLPAEVSSGLGALGLQDINQARSELRKDLGRLQTNYTERAGSDERARTILSGLPTDETPTQTIHQAMDITRGSARQDLALGRLQQKNYRATGGQMYGFQGDYEHATASASPLMHEYLALSPQEQVGFFKRNFQNKEQARAFRAQAESVRRMSPDAVGQ